MKNHLSIVVPIREGSVRVKIKTLEDSIKRTYWIYKILKLKKLKE